MLSLSHLKLSYYIQMFIHILSNMQYICILISTYCFCYILKSFLKVKPSLLKILHVIFKKRVNFLKFFKNIFIFWWITKLLLHKCCNESTSLELQLQIISGIFAYRVTTNIIFLIWFVVDFLTIHVTKPFLKNIRSNMSIILQRLQKKSCPDIQQNI